MKLTQQKTYQLTNSESTEFSVEMTRDQIAHLTRLQVTSLYKNPFKASVREIVSNAYDANLEANPDDPEEIVVTYQKDRVIIRDYGIGLSEERINTIYKYIGSSSKRDDDNQIGAYGIGRLAPLALNNKFVLESFLDGVKRVYCVYLNDIGIPAITKWDEQPSDEPNGLAVNILLPDDIKCNYDRNIDTISEVINGSRYKVKFICNTDERYKRDLKWFNDHKLFSVKVEPNFECDYYPININTLKRFRATDSNTLSVILDIGGALYPIFDTYNSSYRIRLSNVTLLQQSLSNLNYNDLNTYNTRNSGLLIFRLSPDSFPLTSSREDIIDNEEITNRIDKLFNKASSAAIKVNQERLQNQVDSLNEVDKLDLLLKISKSVSYKFSFIGEESIIVSLKGLAKESIDISFDISIAMSKSRYSLAYYLEDEEQNYRLYSLEPREFACVSFPNETVTHRFYDYTDNEESPFYPHQDLIYNKNETSGRHRSSKGGTINLSNYILTNCQFFINKGIKVTPKRLKEAFGDSVLDNPLIEIRISKETTYKESLDYFTDLKPLINFIGEYDPKVSTKSLIGSSKVTPRKIINQIQKTCNEYIYEEITRTLYSSLIDRANSRLSQSIDPNDLSSTLLYFNKSLGEVTNDMAFLLGLPDKVFPKDIIPKVVVTTNSSTQSLKELKIPWVDARQEACSKVAKHLLDSYQFRLSLIEYNEALPLLNCFREGNLRYLLPKATAELLDFSIDELLNIKSFMSYSYFDLNSGRKSLSSILYADNLDENIIEYFENYCKGESEFLCYILKLYDKQQELYKGIPCNTVKSLFGKQLEPIIDTLFDITESITHSYAYDKSFNTSSEDHYTQVTKRNIIPFLNLFAESKNLI